MEPYELDRLLAPYRVTRLPAVPRSGLSWVPVDVIDVTDEHERERQPVR